MSATSQYRGIDKLTPEFRTQVENWFKEKINIKGVKRLVKDVIFLTETWRDEARQAYLFNQKPRVTWLNGKPGNRSLHQDGLAVDIAFNGNELYPADQELWRAVADAAKKHGIDWGFDLWKWDRQHFQDAKAPYTPPPKDYGLNEWQQNAMNWGTAFGVTNGERPLENLTRVEAVELLRKFYILITKK